MELSRQEYPALLATLYPGQATTVLSDRIRVINKIHSDIADFLQVRLSLAILGRIECAEVELTRC
jgi:hypothetical protein